MCHSWRALPPPSTTEPIIEPSTQPAYRLSGVGRSLDPSYPTNRAVLVVLPVVLLLATGWVRRAGAGWVEALGSGLNAALVALLSWALTRELSPDHDPVAFLAMGLALGGWLVLGDQSIVVPAAVLMSVRLVNRSSGKAAEATDAPWLVLLFAAVIWLRSWTVGVTAAMAFALDAVLPVPKGQPARRWHLGFAALLLGLTGTRLITGAGGLEMPPYPWLLAGLAALCVAAGVGSPTPGARGDVDGLPLVPVRVRVGILLGVLAVSGATLDEGVRLGELAATWSCVVAPALATPLLGLRRS